MSRRHGQTLKKQLVTFGDASSRLLLGKEIDMKKLMVALVALMMSVGVWAHSGGTDKNGCHHDRKSGGYHCH